MRKQPYLLLVEEVVVPDEMGRRHGATDEGILNLTEKYPIKTSKERVVPQVVVGSSKTIAWVVFIEELANQAFRMFHQK